MLLIYPPPNTWSVLHTVNQLHRRAHNEEEGGFDWEVLYADTYIPEIEGQFKLFKQKIHRHRFHLHRQHQKRIDNNIGKRRDQAVLKWCWCQVKMRNLMLKICQILKDSGSVNVTFCELLDLLSVHILDHRVLVLVRRQLLCPINR